MSHLAFHKYQGTGNDFILLNEPDRDIRSLLQVSRVRTLCDRHFGIGADGLIVLTPEAGYDFRMDYYNSDGRPGSMCGNGGRCAVAFAHALGLIGRHCRFRAFDGPHEALVKLEGATIDLQMKPVADIEENGGYFFLDTGSPHHVCFVDDLEEVDVVAEGRRIRHSERYLPGGTNVNFVEKRADGIAVATYERGVEQETLSCGTGVTAAAIAYLVSRREKEGLIPVQTRGGRLEVRLKREGPVFREVWLSGPAIKVFEGTIQLGCV